ncbi:MAG TPA: DUF6152 family protein [Bryobacteraceae bacterium]
MMTRIQAVVLGAAAAMFSAAVPASAHHAFGAEFDASRPVLLKGKIVKVEWVNPHTWLHVEIVKDDGNKEVWMVEGGSPNSLLRRGATKNSFPVGTEVVVDGYQARDHTELRANARNVTFTDGRKVFLGSTGTGAPPPESFPEDKVKPPTGK